jgi:tetratricopeptide (TPR) repeat protein
MNRAVNKIVDASPATSGDIAVINLKSACEHSWSQFLREPLRPGIAERIVEEEHLTNQFLGELTSLDRLEMMAGALSQLEPEAARTSLIQAQVASMTHRFREARDYLSKANVRGASPAAIEQLSLSIDQACGVGLEAVLGMRRQRAAVTQRLEDLVPLGALLADLGEYDEADLTYRKALRGYRDVSPFAVAWVCFQLGVLWGEVADSRKLDSAARWYQQAIDYLPGYVKARVHLAEIYLSCGRTEEAATILAPAIASGEPEVHWRLADTMTAEGRLVDAGNQLRLALVGFEMLLGKQLLAFADHGAEFYSGSGGNPARAFELARINLLNRPTLKAYGQAHTTAIGAGEYRAGEEIRACATEQWGWTAAFRHSPFAASN